MKKKLSKNYIAFTLTEMTMVLLIMSVIAAVSAPLVKHAVSDVTNNSVGIPTKLWGKVNGLAGIHNLNGDAGIVSIGTIPSGDPINYNNPALMIQANGNNVSQIGLYSGYSGSSIAMDRYNNILVGSDCSSKNSCDSHYSYDSIKIGENILSSLYKINKDPKKNFIIYGSHVYLGRLLTKLDRTETETETETVKLYADNTVRVAMSPTLFLENNKDDSYSVVMDGTDNLEVTLTSKETSVWAKSNAIVAQLYGVSIGKGVPTEPMQSVFIGNDDSAGMVGALARLNKGNLVGIGHASLGNNIYRSSGDNIALDTVAIGSYAAYIFDDNYSVTQSVFIGSYAGMHNRLLNKSIAIGSSAALGYPPAEAETSHNETISIGFFANWGDSRGREDFINNDAVSIGNYSGTFRTVGSSAIYIGNYAGYQSAATLAIGTNACRGNSSESLGHSCIGNFSDNGRWYSDYAMLLYANGYSGRIVLAAKNVYAPASENIVMSDVRLKRKISLAPYSIKDFRKFNIYNFSLKYDKDHLKHIGVIAQEYRKAFPLAIVKGGKYLSIQPDWLYYSMINAVKDLDKLVQEFQVKLDEYVNNFESIKSRISTLEQSVAKEKQNNANMRKELEQINAQLLAKTKNNNKL